MTTTSPRLSSPSIMARSVDTIELWEKKKVGTVAALMTASPTKRKRTVVDLMTPSPTKRTHPSALAYNANSALDATWCMVHGAWCCAHLYSCVVRLDLTGARPSISSKNMMDGRILYA